MTTTIYCECETPIMDVEHDAGCHRCGRPVDFTPRCSCTYAAYAKIGGGTGFDIARFDPACPEHGEEGDDA